MKGRSTLNIVGLLIKLILGVTALYVAYLLFRFAANKGDWEFIASPIKSFMNSLK
jgi:hypothetical protein